MIPDEPTPSSPSSTSTPSSPPASPPTSDPKPAAETSSDDDAAIGAEDATLRPTNAEPGEGATTTIGGDGDDNPQRVEVAGDPDGVVTNRYGGTLQSETTPEELPSDAKIAPVAEQVNPNAAAQAVGAQEQPAEIASVEQPKEGEKNVVEDASDATQFLPEDSEQHEDAERAAEDARRDADRGRH